MTEAKPEEERQTRPFADVLNGLRRGRTHREMSEHMQDLTAAVIETGKPGTLTLTIKVVPTKDPRVVEVADKVTLKAPEQRAASLFYVTDDHQLSRTDPEQAELDLGPRAIPTTPNSQEAAQ
jgi:hypothetical protein